jgi:glyoxylase-like metal-dependent hydrolase (beta-lactamase superfamily II)/rhodanese-related sulfurtransferase
VYPFRVLVFRQLYDQRSSTYTYLLADRASGEAVIIDPVFEQVRRDAALVAELGLTLRWTLETHVHADHVTGAWLLRERLGARIALAGAAGAEGADRGLVHGDRVTFGGRALEVRATPGHTDGCLTFVLDDRSMAFTGDCLMIRAAGRTDFQQGDARTMWRSVREQIFSLPDDCLVWPAHDYQGRTVTTVGEEKTWNPRLGGDVAVDDFVGYMDNLRLPHPNQMDVAVPANLRCGKPDKPEAVKEPTWAPLTYTFAGVWEVEPRWLEEHLAEVQLVDVRQPDEYVGDLGHIRGARLIPLGTLLDHKGELDRARPLVVVCRAGSRSAQATVLLRREGFEHVANLAGGMIRWRAMHLPVEGSVPPFPAVPPPGAS